MQKKIWKWASLIIILTATIKMAIPAISSDAQTVPQAANNSIDPKISAHMLQTSIQITMVDHVLEKMETTTDDPDQEEVFQKVARTTSGLGTLVNHDGEVLLISHDHWSLFTSITAPDVVIFRDAEGFLLFEMAGRDLLPLILFHDSGTFILKAPEALATRAVATADIGSFENLSPGDIVHVVHHPSSQADQLSVMAVEIIGQEVFNGVPMLSLRSLDGQSIEPGDSGGGIWVNGRLTGNMWMTVREVRQYWWQLEPPDQNKTAFSLAAGLPNDLIILLETLLQVQSPPSLETDGMS